MLECELLSSIYVYDPIRGVVTRMLPVFKNLTLDAVLDQNKYLKEESADPVRAFRRSNCDPSMVNEYRRVSSGCQSSAPANSTLLPHALDTCYITIHRTRLCRLME